MFKYMYIDESGDLGKRGSKYLVLAALIIDEPRELKRIIKNMRRNKFKKQLKKVTEIKANNSSPEVICHMIKKLNTLESAKVFYIVLEKRKLFSEFLKNDKHKLYNYVAGKLAKNIILEGVDIDIKIDKSKDKQLLREDFDKYFERNLREGCKTIKCKIEHSWSHSWDGIQFADILAWACFQKFEHGNGEYIDLSRIEQDVYHVW